MFVIYKNGYICDEYNGLAYVSPPGREPTKYETEADAYKIVRKSRLKWPQATLTIRET